MKVTSKNGQRKVELTKVEHDKLQAAHVLCGEIGDLLNDKAAAEAEKSLEELVARYPAPETRKKQTA